MKKFEDPILNLEKIDVEDVITTSSCDLHCDDCDWET